ncbi:MAG TPA: hypothetical protein VM243_08760 [Phycisphaerae bacterium]|nr:hypothetical protein [Phycisphaerae bacterium]
MTLRARVKGSSCPLFLLIAGSWIAATGCSQKEPLAFDPARVPNPMLGPMTIAVAPALNFSGSPDFDRNTVADLMASELGYVEGITVIPVSRVLAVLARQGRNEVESPRHALEIGEQLGADAVLVFAITEYDPYDPPTVGLAAQLYGQAPWCRPEDELDPMLVAGQAGLVAANPTQEPPGRLLVQAQRTFNASHHYIVQQVKTFARRRGTRDSPYGWRLYLVSQTDYLRFCCATILEAMVFPPQARMVSQEQVEAAGQP